MCLCVCRERCSFFICTYVQNSYEKLWDLHFEKSSGNRKLSLDVLSLKCLVTKREKKRKTFAPFSYILFWIMPSSGS